MPAICKNLSLTAEEISRGVCATGKYDDQAISAGVGVDGKREFANSGRSDWKSLHKWIC